MGQCLSTRSALEPFKVVIRKDIQDLEVFDAEFMKEDLVPALDASAALSQVLPQVPQVPQVPKVPAQAVTIEDIKKSLQEARNAMDDLNVHKEGFEDMPPLISIASAIKK